MPGSGLPGERSAEAGVSPLIARGDIDPRAGDRAGDSDKPAANGGLTQRQIDGG